MKYSSSQFVLVALIIAALASPVIAQRGSLKIDSFPPGAAILIDGTATGRITPTTISLEVGDHAITIDGGSGWTPDARIVTIGAGATELTVTLLPAVPGGPRGA